MNIHIIEILNKFVKLPEDNWESGLWSLDEPKAQKLVGGEIYFHRKRNEPSYFGGSITGYRVAQDEDNQDKIIFTFKYAENCRNVKTDKQGWAKNVKCGEI